MRVLLAILVVLGGLANWSVAQSSSLFKRHEARRQAEQAATTQPTSNGALRSNAGSAVPRTVGGNVALAQTSLTAIRLPEPKVIKVNDFISVIVRYRLRHQSSSKVKQDAEWDTNTKLGAWFRIHDRKWQQQQLAGGKPEIDFKNKSELENEGKADRQDVFETRVMGKVMDIKPNGNLVIVAWSRMVIDNEVQYVRLSGECNRDYIMPDGSITSDKVFGLDVATMNEGAVRDAVKRGWFKEFVDFAKPF